MKQKTKLKKSFDNGITTEENLADLIKLKISNYKFAIYN